MALIPDHFLKSIVSIEEEQDGEVKSIGTGFIFMEVIDAKTGADGKVNVTGREYLVTACHVFLPDLDLNNITRREVWLRFDNMNGKPMPPQRVPLYHQSGQALFTFPSGKSPIDVAVLRLNVTTLAEQNIDYDSLVHSHDTILENEYEAEGIRVGGSVYVIGFPYGLRGKSKNYAICRSGTIARLDKEILQDSVIYLDSPVFPGNSGGPVFTKPEAEALSGTKPCHRSALLGLVSTFMSKDIEGYSEENQDHIKNHLRLSKIVTVDAILEAVKEHQKKFPAGSKNKIVYRDEIIRRWNEQNP